MTESAEIADDAPSPWWPCPECGGAEFRTTVLFERGRWIEYAPDEGAYEEYEPPYGEPTAVSAQVECATCGHTFDIADHYNWPEGAPDES